MNKKGGENGEFSSRRKIVRLVPFHPFYPHLPPPFRTFIPWRRARNLFAPRNLYPPGRGLLTFIAKPRCLLARKLKDARVSTIRR